MATLSYLYYQREFTKNLSTPAARAEGRSLEYRHGDSRQFVERWGERGGKGLTLGKKRGKRTPEPSLGATPSKVAKLRKMDQKWFQQQKLRERPRGGGRE